MRETDDFARIEQTIIALIQEEQIKLGYRREMIRLYYPLLSLNRTLGSSYTAEELLRVLSDYFAGEKSVLGQVEVSRQGERFCLAIPEKGVAYVHEHEKGQGFLEEFIHAIAEHDCTIERLSKIFHAYSGRVHFEKIDKGEFDYLLYFEDGKPDDFRYCITDEGCHMSYHRFTPEDYADFAFGENG